MKPTSRLNERANNHLIAADQNLQSNDGGVGDHWSNTVNQMLAFVWWLVHLFSFFVWRIMSIKHWATVLRSSPSVTGAVTWTMISRGCNSVCANLNWSRMTRFIRLRLTAVRLPFFGTITPSLGANWSFSRQRTRMAPWRRMNRPRLNTWENCWACSSLRQRGNVSVEMAG